MVGCEMGMQSIRRDLSRLLGSFGDSTRTLPPPGQSYSGRPLRPGVDGPTLAVLQSATALEIKVPGYSLGRDRVTKNQARSATRLQTLGVKKKEFIAAVRSLGPTPTLRPAQVQNEGRTQKRTKSTRMRFMTPSINGQQYTGQLDPRMGTGSGTISILRTEGSDKTLYDLYVTRTKSLQIQGQDSQPTWYLHRSDSSAEIEEVK